MTLPLYGFIYLLIATLLQHDQAVHALRIDKLPSTGYGSNAVDRFLSDKRWSTSRNGLTSSALAKSYSSSTKQEKQRLREERIAQAGIPFPAPENPLMLEVLRGTSKSSTPPVWLMRQAGRYLPEFREMRAAFDFLTICRDPKLAAEISMQPYKRFPLLDAVIIFSDILVVPQAMGQPLRMIEGEGPVFDWEVSSPSVLPRLTLSPNIEETLGYVFDAIYLLRRMVQNRVPVIGFCGGPFTVMAYMIEGKSTVSWTNARYWLYNYPDASHKLLRALTDISVEYLIKQYDAGASILQVFETNGGILPPALFEEFSAKYMIEIAERVKKARPDALMIAFPKDQPSSTFKASMYDGISIGWREDIEAMKLRFSGDMTLQGNLDPKVLYSSKEVIRRETSRMKNQFGSCRYIANLGHGMEPQMSPDAVAHFLQTVKQST